jgi:hypothetical protein
MEVLATLALGMVGFLVGNLLFSNVAMWTGSMYEVAKAPDEGSKSVKLASAALLASGPWFLAATALFAIYVRSESWAPPIFAGAVIAIVFFSVFTWYLARKRKGVPQ